MVKSVDNGVSLPPFLVKCYEMVSDESTDGLISWSESSDSFIIWDESRFSSQLLPKYFKHSNFSSFVRQLNIYGFRKIDTDQWQFANEAFRKDQKHLLKNIIRRKHPQNQTEKKPVLHRDEEPEDEKRLALWKEVETLKMDKIALTQELKKLSQQQQTSKSKMVVLREQLKGMEKNQQQMLSFIVMAMQNPEFMLQFFQPKENTWRVSENGNTKLSEVTDDCGGAIVRYGQVGPTRAGEASGSDGLMELDLSVDEIRELFMDIDVLLEEGSVPVESHEVFVVPSGDESDDMLEQLLLPYPSMANVGLAELDGGAAAAASSGQKQIGLTIESDESEDSGNDALDDVRGDSVDALAERMEVLTSEIRGS
ncbi:Heat stress transcription factor A-8 [Striga hermonthica]|uniref:Heat stress transcription factor A-8 n=1 Tax=Striga hermonthica TaxID=68872 RepID=A0A9N7R290_STRHE|nr:Heat stress transcription factor A-8 [Striga hermonthica]